MKNMNKKGFTLVEVIVSVVLVSVIMVSMLAALVKLRDTYKVIHDNSDVIVYTSSIARVINNDLMKNNGIRYANCNLEGTDCELILGNDSRRRLEILEEGNGVDLGEEYYSEKKIKHEKIISTLRYTDITKKKEDEEGTLLYIRTLTMDRYTKQTADNKDTNTVTTEGYNFYDISVPEPKEYYGDATEEGKYVDTISTVYIRIWDGKSLESTKYDISLYSSGRYDESGLIGKTYRIQLNTDGAYSPGTLELDEVFGVAYFDSEKNHSSINIKKKITIPKKKDGEGNQLAFLGYFYYKASDTVGTQVIDSTGKIVSSSRLFKNDIELSDGTDYERVVALWGVCDNGYKVNNKGECVPEEYLVTLVKGCGIFDPDNETTEYNAKYNSLVPSIAKLPSCTGHQFQGYYSDGVLFNDSTGAGKIIYTYQGPKTATGSWLANTITLEYVKNSDSASGASYTQSCTYGVECKLLSNNFTNPGYIFTGWKKNNLGSSIQPGVDVNPAAAEGTVTYYAQWSPCGKGKYTNGNVCADCPTGKYSTGNANATCQDCPTGYTTESVGSQAKSACYIDCADNTRVASADAQCSNCSTGYHLGGHRIYASNTSDSCAINTYTVTYNTNTTDTVGSMPGSQTKTYGVDLTLSNNTPTRSGYTFSGWNTAANGSGTPYSKGGTYSSNANVTLYAKWTGNDYYTCSVTLEGDARHVCCATSRYGYWGSHTWFADGVTYCQTHNLTKAQADAWTIGGCHKQSGYIDQTNPSLANCINHRG